MYGSIATSRADAGDGLMSPSVGATIESTFSWLSQRLPGAHQLGRARRKPRVEGVDTGI